MKYLTWPLAVVLCFLIAVIAIMFWRSNDPAMQNQLLGHLGTIIISVVGAAGFAVGYLKAKKIIQ